MAGTRNYGSGTVELAVGDYLIHNGTVWEKADTTDAVSTVNGYTGNVSLTKSDVGLGNVDDTSDADKPVSTATQTALNAKEGTVTAGTTGQYWRGDKTWQTLDKSAVSLGSVDNTADADKNVLSATKLTTARTINGVSFDGTANITVPIEVSAIQGGVIYGDTTTSYASTTAGTAGQLLTSGGTGAPTWTSTATAATASTVALRDSNGNLSADAFFPGFTSTATAAGTTTLTVNSSQFQQFTGTSTQTVRLPTTSVPAGAQYFIINNSTGLVTVQSSGANTITVLPGGVESRFTALQATPTTAAHWEETRSGATAASGKVLTVSNSLTLAGTDATTMTFPPASGTVLTADSTATLSNKNFTGTGNTFPTLNQNTTGSAATLTTARTFLTNLASTATASFDGSANATPGVTGTLAVGNGGTGATTLTGILKGNGTSAFTAATAGTDYVAPGGALGTPSSGNLANCTFPTLNQNTTGSAATLTTARTFQTNLASTASASFNGSANVTPGVTGTLPVGNGGTGATTLTGLVVGNGTSAMTTVTAPTGAVVGTTDTQTLTNKRINPRIGTTASSATPSINCDTTDVYTITALAAAITSVTVTGTPADGQKLMIRIKDNGTARAIAWGASFASSGAATLLTTTVASKTHHVGFIYDGVQAKWVCLACDYVGY